MRNLRPRVLALKLAAKVRERLSGELGQPVKVIMYGSQARSDTTKESDIDLLIILPSINKDASRIISDVAWEVGFDAGKLISAFPATEDGMKRFSFLAFYKNVKKEGVVV